MQVGAVVSFWINYNEVSSKGEYDPKLLAINPALIRMGLVAMVRPDFDISPKNKVAIWITAAIAGVALIFRFHLPHTLVSGNLGRTRREPSVRRRFMTDMDSILDRFSGAFFG